MSRTAPARRDLFPIVQDILRSAAAEAILPRYRALGDGEIIEKSPGDLVTVADREAEALIARGLQGLVPGARVVGEEMCAADPGLMEGLDQGAVWLIDPVDGTSNFAAGREPFGVMAALVQDGATVAAWIHHPLEDRTYAAEAGGGAWLDGERLTADAAPEAGALRGSVMDRYLPPPEKARVGRAIPTERRLPGHFCCAAEYPAVTHGDRHFAVYWRTLPWDHAPGALILSEAGGRALRWDGAPYRPGASADGLVIARDAATADTVGRLLRAQGRLGP